MKILRVVAKGRRKKKPVGGEVGGTFTGESTGKLQFMIAYAACKLAASFPQV